MSFAFGHSAREFSKPYRCFSMSHAPKFVPDNIKYGGKIFLPVSALEHLASLNIVYPMLFQLRSGADKTTHCGVLEFIAEEGRVYLPEWMMAHLNVKNGDFLMVKSASIPVGKFVKIEPQSEAFLEISNPKAVLETALRNFACLTVGDMISIKYNQKIFQLKVLEAKPTAAISIIEADVEVDFAPPPGYVSPVKKEEIVPEPKFEEMSSEGQDDLSSPTSSNQPSFVPFAGAGQKLANKKSSSTYSTNPSSTTTTTTANSSGSMRIPSAAVPINSSAGSSPSPSPSNASLSGSMSSKNSLGRSASPKQTSSFTPKNAAPVNVTAGKLMFGKVSNTTNISGNQATTTATAAAGNQSSLTSSLNKANNTTSQNAFKAFSGAGNSLK